MSTMDLLKLVMTQEEVDNVHDTVLGHLTAEDVFARIKVHYESCK